jgi:hypothetical protein
MVELTGASWPHSVTFAPTSLIDKDGTGPLQKRPITLLPIMYAAYTGIRYRHTRQWQAETLPPELYGGRAGLSTSSAELPAALELQLRQLLLHDQPDHDQHEVCVNEDRTKCFDLFKAGQTAQVMQGVGIYPPLCNAVRKFYNMHTRRFKIDGTVGECFATDSLVQGCALSLLQVNCCFAVLVLRLRRMQPLVRPTLFVDDCKMRVDVGHVDQLVEALGECRTFDTLTGQRLNAKKSCLMASSVIARRKAQDILSFEGTVKEVDKGLGFTINYSMSQSRKLQNERVNLAEQDVLAAMRLPRLKALRIETVMCACMPKLSYGVVMVLPVDRLLYKLRLALPS